MWAKRLLTLSFAASGSNGRGPERLVPLRGPAMSVSQLPPAIRDDEKDRLLRRSEHNARAREHAAKVAGHNESERIKKRDAFRREDSMARRTFVTSLREREERWVYKTQASPFHEDLWATDERQFFLNIHRNKELQKKEKLANLRQREAYDAIRRRATAEINELDELRAERRFNVQSRKHLKAMKDVNKTNIRAAKVIEDRNKRAFDKQQLALERAMSDPCLM
ncbi:hypothetical protein AK812_SmicGene19237 [Symbiodinium microadriaticum]|uniref:Uncharacterized protein n=1 Tax=Symbiodinium microadriaticum TaxID=2951 RepID=A0A1Q9DT12_SYMMI|nr:hypothetical protein AK812_SmicGene19237 [Symbiodinium microadriaticum]